MYEITQKGAWFKWSALDRTDKRLVALSMIAAGISGMVVGMSVSETAYQLGYLLGSGGTPADDHGPLSRLVGLEAYRWATVAGLLAAIVSGIAWWRFSRRQDELFNRVQNYAIGHGAAWSLAAALGWWMLSLGGWTGAFPLGWFILLAFALVCLFWFVAIRRWA